MRATPEWRTDADGTLRRPRMTPAAYTVRKDGEKFGTVAVGREPVKHRFEN